METVKKAVAADAAIHINEAEKAAEDHVIKATMGYSAELNAMEQSRDSEAERASALELKLRQPPPLSPALPEA